LTNELTATLFA